MQASARSHDTRDNLDQPNLLESKPPDPVAVLRAYSGGVGLPSDRWKLDLQAQVVGAVLFVLAGICLLMTVVLLLALWLPAWLVALGLTVGLTGLGLALFASVARPAIYAPTQVQQPVEASPAEDLSTIEEIDPTEVESMRDPGLSTEIPRGDRPRLTPHPIIAADAVDAELDNDADVDDAKTRPIGEAPFGTPAHQPLRAEMPSGVALNH